MTDREALWSRMETLGALSQLALGAQLLLLGKDRFSPVPTGLPGTGVLTPAGT